VSSGLDGPGPLRPMPLAVQFRGQQPRSGGSVNLDRRLPPAQRLRSEGLEREAFRAAEAAERLRRDEELPAKPAGGLLETGGRVHHVPVEHDVALALADLAADDGPRVEGRPQPRRDTELQPE